MMPHRQAPVHRLSWLALLLLILVALPVLAAPAVDPALLKDLPWREVGPFRGGRAAVVAGVPSQPLTYYFGATGGGVWKTVDGGATWKNVSDGFFGGSIGAVAVSEWDPNVVYVGGGEVTLRGNVSPGNGLWKSTDAGKTWTSLGFADAQHIPRIRIHPKNPDLVYMAVLGHTFGPNDTRGVYRTKDGGKSWERILFVSKDVGAVDLILDPVNPRTVYASTWRVRRSPWGFDSGGSGSALWKSTDGGDSWNELSRKPGMPKGMLGIIGITVSPSNPQNLYAIVEAADGGVFRSKDGGENWMKVSESRDLRQRAWYYSRLIADPKDEDTVYAPNVRFHRSKDGGKTWPTIRTPHGDNHDLWIAPDDPLRMIESNDGGANVSTDGGATWSTQENQPTAQIYRVTADNDFPYRLLGAQQDNSAFRIRHRSEGPGIGRGDWEETAGGESGYIVPDPQDPDVVYGGSYGGFLTRVNHRTHEFRDVNPWPDNPMGWGAADLKYRFQWNFPIAISPHDPKTLYAAANVLFKSTDSGASWQVISPDLTRNDKSKQGPAGGPLTKDNTSIEYYDTIFYVAESPLTAGLLWAGSDDGLIHVSKDGGKDWQNVTPKGLPEWIMINSLEPSPYEPGGLYVAATLYKSDDFRPYLYKTSDYGATWTKITDGIPADHFTRVVRADPVRRGLLYAGTERGIYVSFDDGGHWQSLQGKLPIVPVTDLLVKEGSLIAATQGRAFWMLDDLTPLRELNPQVASQPFYLFPPQPTYRVQGGGGFRGAPRAQGTNPPAGVVVQYNLKDVKAGTKVKLEILTPDGKLVRSFSGEVKSAAQKAEEKKAAEEKLKTEAEKGKVIPAEPASGPGAGAPAKEGEKQAQAEAAEEDEEDEGRRGPPEPKIPVEPGLNRFAWDLSYPEAKRFPGLVLWGQGGLEGPAAVPGRYQVRLTVGKDSATQAFELRPDPRSKTTPQDLAAQLAFLTATRDKLSEVHGEIRKIREVRAQLGDLKKRLGKGDDKKPLVQAADDLDKKMTAIEEALYQTKNRSNEDPLNFPIRLNDKLANLAQSVAAGDYPPTAQAQEVQKELTAAIDAQLAKLKEIWDQDLPAFNQKVAASNVPAIAVRPEEAKKE
ncbi:MAG TPA: glycosyl hydrolase [Thermoanaerobaculia bacterium]|nr:glycosyl hydrolase [Thermoanaerobaculia bacterium]